MSKKNKKKIAPTFYCDNGHKCYHDGAEAWTDIDEIRTPALIIKSIVYEKFGPSFFPNGVPPSETPQHKFLFLKIPIEMGRRQAQEILADAWGRIKSCEPGKADWNHYKKIYDELDVEISAWESRPNCYSADDIKKSIKDYCTRLGPPIQNVEQARKQSRLKWGTLTNSATLKKAFIIRKVKKLVGVERKKGNKIETAFNTVADSVDRSTESVRRYYYSK